MSGWLITINDKIHTIDCDSDKITDVLNDARKQLALTDKEFDNISKIELAELVNYKSKLGNISKLIIYPGTYYAIAKDEKTGKFLDHESFFKTPPSIFMWTQLAKKNNIDYEISIDERKNFSQRIFNLYNFSNWSDVSYELRGGNFLGQYKNVKMKVIKKNSDSFIVRYQDSTLSNPVEVLVPEPYDKCTSRGVLNAIDSKLNRSTKSAYYPYTNKVKI